MSDHNQSDAYNLDYEHTPADSQSWSNAFRGDGVNSFGGGNDNVENDNDVEFPNLVECTHGNHPGNASAPFTHVSNSDRNGFGGYPMQSHPNPPRLSTPPTARPPTAFLGSNQNMVQSPRRFTGAPPVTQFGTTFAGGSGADLPIDHRGFQGTRRVDSVGGNDWNTPGVNYQRQEHQPMLPRLPQHLVSNSLANPAGPPVGASVPGQMLVHLRPPDSRYFTDMDQVREYVSPLAWYPSMGNFGIPIHDTGKAPYIRCICQAIANTENVWDEEALPLTFKNFQAGGQLTNAIHIEAIAHLIVEAAIELHQSGARGIVFEKMHDYIPRDEDQESTFTQRIWFVVVLLAHCKAAASHVMTMGYISVYVTIPFSKLCTYQQFVDFWNPLKPVERIDWAEVLPYRIFPDAQYPTQEEQQKWRRNTKALFELAESAAAAAAPAAPQSEPSPSVPQSGFSMSEALGQSQPEAARRC